MRRITRRIDQIAGAVITLRADHVRYRELAEVAGYGGRSLAQVIRLAGDRVALQVFAGTRGITTDAAVEFLGHPMQTAFSPALLGRVFTGSGAPRDQGPPIEENPTPIGGPSVNPAKRVIPHRMIRTGIPMIDVFNTLVESQKLPIFSVAGEPYNALLARIALQAEVDIILLGGMGLKHDDYLFFRGTLEEQGALSRSILFIHTAADPTVECLMTPDIALAVAEQFALQGKRVLVLLTDMTNYADSLKEIATRAISTASWPRATRRRWTSTGPARLPSWRSPQCRAMTSPTRCPTTPATSPRASSTSATATSSPSAR